MSVYNGIHGAVQLIRPDLVVHRAWVELAPQPMYLVAFCTVGRRMSGDHRAVNENGRWDLQVTCVARTSDSVAVLAGQVVEFLGVAANRPVAAGWNISRFMEIESFPPDASDSVRERPIVLMQVRCHVMATKA